MTFLSAERRWRRGVLVLSACLPLAFARLPIAAAEAAEPQVPSKLTLKQAISLALDNNPGLKQTQVSLLNARSSLVSGKDLTEATIRAGVTQFGATSGDNDTAASAGAEITIDRLGGDQISASIVPLSTSSLASSLQIEYRRPLFKGRGLLGQRNVQITGLEYSLASQEHRAYLDRQNTVENTIQSYFRAVQNSEMIKVREYDVEMARDSVTTAQKKLAEGLVAEIEVSRAQNQLAQSQDSLVSQKRQYRDSLDALLLRMGLKVGQNTELTDTAVVEPVKLDANTLVQEALESRRDISVAQIGIDRQKLELSVARDDQRPGVDLFGSYVNEGVGVFGGGGSLSDSNWTAGLTYSYPLGSVSRRERREQASRELGQMEIEFDYLKQEIKDEVLRSVRALEAAEASIDILRANQKISEDRLHLAQRMVEEGLVVNRDVLEAQRDLTSTRASLLGAQIDYYLSLVALKRSTGRDIATEMGS